MSDSMAEIKGRAYISFGRIFQYDFVLQFYRMEEYGVVNAAHGIGLQVEIIATVEYQAGVDHFGKPRKQCPPSKRIKKISIDAHGKGIGKGPDDVFYIIDINPGLSAYRCVHL